MPEQGGSFVDLLFVKSPTEASLEISVCTVAICLLFTSKTLDSYHLFEVMVNVKKQVQF